PLPQRRTPLDVGKQKRRSYGLGHGGSCATRVIVCCAAANVAKASFVESPALAPGGTATLPGETIMRFEVMPLRSQPRPVPRETAVVRDNSGTRPPFGTVTRVMTYEYSAFGHGNDRRNDRVRNAKREYRVALD